MSTLEELTEIVQEVDELMEQIAEGTPTVPVAPELISVQDSANTIPAAESKPEPVSIPDTEVEVYAQEALLLEDCVKVTLSNGAEKTISYESMIEILKASINVVTEDQLEGFSLPSNVFYFAKSGNTIHMSCYYSSRVCNLKYWDSKFDILVPNIIVSHVLNRKTGAKDWEVTSSRYFCTDLPVGNLKKCFISGISYADRVFLLPLSNTYDNGSMCYGSNQMPKRFTENNLRGLDWYYQYLWESPFNDDLGIKATSMYPKDWYTLLKNCAVEKAAFPYEKLRGFKPR